MQCQRKDRTTKVHYSGGWVDIKVSTFFLHKL